MTEILNGINVSLQGLLSETKRIATTAQNIANVDSTGFREYYNHSNDMRYGGVYTDTNRYISNRGAINVTGIETDLSIDSGPGLFAVRENNGQVLYTTSGSFPLNKDLKMSSLDSKYFLQGWEWDKATKSFNTNQLNSIQIDSFISTEATANIETKISLQNDQTADNGGGSAVFNVSGAKSTDILNLGSAILDSSFIVNVSTMENGQKVEASSTYTYGGILIGSSVDPNGTEIANSVGGFDVLVDGQKRISIAISEITADSTTDNQTALNNIVQKLADLNIRAQVTNPDSNGDISIIIAGQNASSAFKLQSINNGLTGGQIQPSGNNIANSVGSFDIIVDGKFRGTIAVSDIADNTTDNQTALANLVNKLAALGISSKIDITNSQVALTNIIPQTAGSALELRQKAGSNLLDALQITKKQTALAAINIAENSSVAAAPLSNNRFASISELVAKIGGKFANIYQDTNGSAGFVASTRFGAETTLFDQNSNSGLLSKLGVIPVGHSGIAPRSSYDPYSSTSNMASKSVTPDAISSVSIYDNLGVAHNLSIALKRLDISNWMMEVYNVNAAEELNLDGYASVNGLLQVSRLNFDGSGMLKAVGNYGDNAQMAVGVSQYSQVIANPFDKLSGNSFTINIAGQTSSVFTFKDDPDVGAGEFNNVATLVTAINNKFNYNNIVASIVRKDNGYRLRISPISGVANQNISITSSVFPDLNMEASVSGTNLESIASPLTLNWRNIDDTNNQDSAILPSTVQFNYSPKTINSVASMNNLILSPDGYRAGEFKELAIDKEGVVTAIYDNNAAIKKYKIPVAIFADTDSLKTTDDGLYQATSSSGPVTMKAAGLGNAGTVVSNSLEMSNADLQKQLPILIRVQQQYAANATALQRNLSLIDTLLSKF